MRILKICSSVLLTISFIAVGYADEHFPFLAEVKKESVNIRSGANTNFEKLGQLNRSEDVIVIGKSFDWYKVQLPSNVKVYVRADYLKVDKNSLGEVVGDKVNLRALPNSESASLGQITNHQIVKVISQINGWWQIEPPIQAVGWIREDFLQLKSLTVKNLQPHSNTHRVEAPIKKSLATLDVKGRLIPVSVPNSQVHFQLVIDGKPAYYVQDIPQANRFKGAMVLIKGLVVSGTDTYSSLPILRVISISFLL